MKPIRTIRPSRRPSVKPIPTIRPSRRPSVKPIRTIRPSRRRSAKPSTLPSVAPSKKRISRRPTVSLLRMSPPFVPPTVAITSRPTEPPSATLPISPPPYELSASAASPMSQSPAAHPSANSGLPLITPSHSRDIPPGPTANGTVAPSRRATSIVFMQVSLTIHPPAE